jgi:hypothetical protein
MNKEKELKKLQEELNQLQKEENSWITYNDEMNISNIFILKDKINKLIKDIEDDKKRNV